MSALDWRRRMKHTPKLVHDGGLVLVQLGEHSVLFPSEADSRFFFEAYTDVPNLSGTRDTLLERIDEKALVVAQERVKALEAEVAVMTRKQEELQAQNRDLAEKAASLTQRARILSLLLKRNGS